MDSLSMLKLIIREQNINYTIFKTSVGVTNLFDLGLRKEILIDYDFTSFTNTLLSYFDENSTLLFFRDSFLCNYAAFRYMNEVQEIEYHLIGPYLSEDISQSQFYHLLQKLGITLVLEHELREYYNSLPKIYETNRFHTLMSTLIKEIFQTDFKIKFVEDMFKNEEELLSYISQSSLIISYKLIEERYQSENKLLEAISQGNYSKAQVLYEQFIQHQITPRFKDPIRHVKNLIIVFNTLCRKTVEGSNVHPFHIDEISRNFAIQIEAIQSLKEAQKLQYAIIRKYCLLVKNYSLTGYSPIIQNVINHIDMNISEPLSLNLLADLYSINTSYLSTLFKKELGITITEYIHSQRVQLAIRLLNKTDMQIQNIAAAVGVNDVNYFIKMFKKINGMTPKEYRDSIKTRREI